jgi:tetratricopeptide (TPR) repeat protein
MITKANLLYRSGKYISAEDFYKRALNLSDSRIDAKIGLGNVCLARNKNDEAENIFLKIISEDSTNQYALEGLGVVNYRKSNFSSALYNFKMAELLGKGFSLSYDALLYEGSIYLHHYDFKNAYICFNLAIRRSNNNGWAHAGIGFCLINGRNFLYSKVLIRKAKKEFTIALRCDKKNPVLLNYIGIAEYGAQLYKDAIKHFEIAINNGASDTTALNALAMAYCKVGQFDKAREIMALVCKMAPTNFGFWNNSAIVESDYLNHVLENDPEANIEEALKKMDKFYDIALTMKTDTAVILNNKGVGYFLAHRYDTARSIYNTITTADTMVRAAIINNIGVVFATTGNLDKGKTNFQNANTIDANDDLSAIDINVDLANQNLFSLAPWKEKKYYYILFYYLPSIPFAPQFNNEMNVPLVKANIASPNEVPEVFRYNYHCNEHVSYKVKVCRSPKQKKIRLTPVDACSH